MRAKDKETISALIEIYKSHNIIKELHWGEGDLIEFLIDDLTYVLDLSDYPDQIMIYSNSLSADCGYVILYDQVFDLDFLDTISENPYYLLQFQPDNTNITGYNSDNGITNSDSSNKKVKEIQADEADEADEVDEVDIEIENMDLIRDIQMYKILYGDKNLQYRSIPDLDSIDIQLHFDPVDVFVQMGLSKQNSQKICTAWDIDANYPITIAFKSLSLENYLKNQSIPEFDISQSKDSLLCDKFQKGIGLQLYRLLHEFISIMWGSNMTLKLDVYHNALNLITPDTKSFFTTHSSAAGACSLKQSHSSAAGACSLKQSHSQECRTFLETLMNHTDLDTITHTREPNGFFCEVAEYLAARLRTLNDYCVLCDSRHIHSAGLNYLRTCHRGLCMFARQELGLAADTMTALGTNIIDFMILIAKKASESTRAQIVFDPYPTIYEYNNSDVMVLNPEKPDYNLVRAIYATFPSTTEIMTRSDKEVKRLLDTSHKYAYPLLQWTLDPGRSQLTRLIEPIQEMVTPYQYLLLSAAPEKEQRFQQLKDQFGSEFSFHGSGLENWHAILRYGLRVASGTKYQVNGAAYGKGIYLSPQGITSLGYSRIVATYNYGTKATTTTDVGGTGETGVQAEQCIEPKDIIGCMAICEVIKDPEYLKKHNAMVWTVTHEDYLCPRFFFVFTHQNVKNLKAFNVNTTDQAFHQKLVEHLSASSSII